MFEKQIANGMAWLDANKPGWVNGIDLDVLSVESSCRCVLGQVYGPEGFCDFIELIRGSGKQVWDYGFSPDHAAVIGPAMTSKVAYAALDSEWIAAIRQRQAQVAPARAPRPAAGVALTAICLR